MSIPGVQIPHCAAPCSRNDSWSESSAPRWRAGSDRHSTVRTTLASAGRRAPERRLDGHRVDSRGVERGRDQLRRQAVVEVSPVLELDLLDGRVADGLERPALDLALAQDRMDDVANVIDRDHVMDDDLA